MLESGICAVCELRIVWSFPENRVTAPDSEGEWRLVGHACAECRLVVDGTVKTRPVPVARKPWWLPVAKALARL